MSKDQGIERELAGLGAFSMTLRRLQMSWILELLPSIMIRMGVQIAYETGTLLQGQEQE